MQSPDGPLMRARSAALVAAVAALLTSIGTVTARAETPAPVVVHQTAVPAGMGVPDLGGVRTLAR